MIPRGGTSIAYRRVLEYVFRRAVTRLRAQSSKNSDALDEIKTDVRFAKESN